MNSIQEKLLQQKVDQLPFSKGLKPILVSGNAITLQDILNIEVFNWNKQFPGFTMHHQQEIISYVKQNNLVEFLKES